MTTETTACTNCDYVGVKSLRNRHRCPCCGEYLTTSPSRIRDNWKRQHDDEQAEQENLRKLREQGIDTTYF